MKLINISTKKYPNMFAIVDDKDFDHLRKWKWHPTNHGHCFYAARSTRKDGPKRNIYMHREVFKVGAGQCIDHINHNGLDNRAENLRACTRQENSWNMSKPRHRANAKTSSKLKGVAFDKSRGKFMAYITVSGRRKNLGRFHSEQEAAIAYNTAAKTLFGDFAAINKGVSIPAALP